MAAPTVNSSLEAYGVGDTTTTQDQAFTIPSLTDGAVIIQFEATSATERHVTDITAGGTAMDFVEQVRSTGSVWHLIIFAWLTNPTAGSTTFQVTTDNTLGGTDPIGWKAVFLEGAHQTQSSLKDQHATGGGSTDPSIGPMTPSENDTIVLASYLSDTNSSLTIGAWATAELQNHDYGTRVSGIGYVRQTTAAAVTATWTGVDDDWAGLIVSFRAPAGGAVNEDGDISEGAEAAASFSAIVNAVGAMTAGVSAGQADSGLAAAVDSISEGAEADALFSAIAQAAAAISEGVEVGESWAAQAQAIGILGAAIEAGAIFDGVTEAAQEAEMTAGSTHAATFLAAVQAIAELTAGASAAATFNAIAGIHGSLSAGASAGATASALAQANAVLVAGAVFGATFSATAHSLATMSAGAEFGDLFSYPSEIRMICAGIVIAARISATITLTPRIDGDPEISTC